MGVARNGTSRPWSCLSSCAENIYIWQMKQEEDSVTLALAGYAFSQDILQYLFSVCDTEFVVPFRTDVFYMTEI